jgi:hypothetical protein
MVEKNVQDWRHLKEHVTHNPVQLAAFGVHFPPGHHAVKIVAEDIK